MPLLVFMASLYFLRRQSQPIQIVSSMIFATATFLFCVTAPISWVWRDGLGPDSVESHGNEAVSRFMKDFVTLAIDSTFLFSFGILLCMVASIIRKRHEKREFNSTVFM